MPARLICPRRIGLRTRTSKYFFLSYGDRIALFKTFDWQLSLKKICGQKGLPGPTTSPLYFLKVSVPMQSNSFTYSISPLRLNCPQLWRNANIIPLFKANKPPSDVRSFRPINLTSCVGELLERMISADCTPSVREMAEYRDSRHVLEKKEVQRIK